MAEISHLYLLRSLPSLVRLSFQQHAYAYIPTAVLLYIYELLATPGAESRVNRLNQEGEKASTGGQVIETKPKACRVGAGVRFSKFPGRCGG